MFAAFLLGVIVGVGLIVGVIVYHMRLEGVTMKDIKEIWEEL